MTERDRPVSRRSFLRGAATAGGIAGLAGTGLVSAADVAEAVSGGGPARGRMHADVVVVGAGLAGIQAARMLRRGHASVLLLEARDRVGGRTLNHPIGGGKVVEIGGQWVGPTQDRLYALAAELGVATFPTYAVGMNVDYAHGLRTEYSGRIPPRPDALAEVEVAIQRLNMMADTVDTDAPWKAANALAWDSVTLQGWMDQNMMSPGAKDLLALGIEAVFAAEPRDVSLLHVVFYVASAGNLNHLINTQNGAQQDRFVGGSQLISIRAAAQLGGALRLSSPVEEIEQDARGVIVRGEGFSVRAKRVVLTVPPFLAGRIAYYPSLPPWRDQLTQRLGQGSVIKVMAIYDAPFWRAAGLSGSATSDLGPVKVTFDNSPPDGTPGVLLGFIEGEEARLATKLAFDDRRQGVIDSFVRYFGDGAKRYRDYVEMDWSRERWTGGCYGTLFGPGVWYSYGHALKAPIGCIHFAGTETAGTWAGYMDGAVRSGDRVAAEVLRTL